MQPEGLEAIISPVFGDVQLAALRLAWRNHTNPPKDRFDAGHGEGAHDLYLWELLEDLYGWIPQTRTATSEARFSRAEIGEKEYAAASVVASRALRVLEERGYMKRAFKQGAVDLTPEGVKLREELLGPASS